MVDTTARSSRVRLIGGLARASHPAPTLAVTAFITALTLRSGRDLAGCLVVAFAVLVGQLSIGWSNDAVDARRDRVARRADKPVAVGAVPPRVAGAAAVVALLVCVPASWLSGLFAGSIHLVVVLAGWSYNLGLKATLASWVPYAVAFGLFPAFVTLGLPAHGWAAGWPAGWVMVAGSLLGVGAHLANVLSDIQADLAAGVRGLPQRLGRARTRRLVPLPLVAATALVVFGPAEPVSAIGWVGLGVVVVLAGVSVGWSQLRPSSRAPFLAILGVVAVTVTLFVVSPALSG